MSTVATLRVPGMSVESLTIGGIIGAALTFLGTISLGILLHFRELRKIAIEATETEATAHLADEQVTTSAWKRFQDEIDRLAKRVERLEKEVRDCHRERAAAVAELAEYKLNLQLRGQSRETAQLVVSALHNDASGKEGPVENLGPKS